LKHYILLSVIVILGHMKNSVHNICTCTQIWTILSVLTKTKPNPNPNPNPITFFFKFLNLIGKVYKTKEVQTVIVHAVHHTIRYILWYFLRINKHCLILRSMFLHHARLIHTILCGLSHIGQRTIDYILSWAFSKNFLMNACCHQHHHVLSTFTRWCNQSFMEEWTIWVLSGYNRCLA